MKGGPQVVWGASGVFHRPRRCDPERACCGASVVRPWLRGETASMLRAIRLGLRACRHPACRLTGLQHSPTRPVPAAAGQEPAEAVPDGPTATVGEAS